MRRCVAFVVSIVAAGPALAEWRAMTGAEVTQALTDATLAYAAATQKFYASGRTLYDAGRPSWGYWAVRGDQYCSQWPPSDGWACYAMQRDDEAGALRFVGAGGDVTVGRFVE